MKKPLFTTKYKLPFWGALVFSGICAFSHRLQAEDTYVFAQSTMITVESETPPPLGFDILYKSRAAELIQFLENVALNSVPPEIRNAVLGQSIRILLKADIPTDGLFTPPPAHDPDRLQLLVRTDLFISQNAEQILTHEFFHAIHYLIHPDEKPWVREGLAQLFEYRVLNRFNGTNLASALREPGTPLEGEYDIHRIKPAQYGHDLLYFYYLWSQCGGDTLFWSITRGSPVAGEFGSEGIDRILRNHPVPEKPQCASFESSALHFEIARIQNKASYSSANPKIHYLLSTTLPGPTPLDAVTPTQLKQLSRFEPLVLEGKAELPAHAPKNVHRFWLEQAYPFIVQEASPSPESIESRRWKQLILKY